MAQSPKITINYFLWTREGPFRFPDRLHRQLISGEISLPQFKNTTQKLIEVVIPRGDVSEATTRGIVYAFDANGFLDLSAVKSVMPATSRFADEGNNVRDILPAINKHYFKSQFTWQPDKVTMNRIRAGLDFGGALDQNKIPIFKKI